MEMPAPKFKAVAPEGPIVNRSPRRLPEVAKGKGKGRGKGPAPKKGMGKGKGPKGKAPGEPQSQKVPQLPIGRALAPCARPKGWMASQVDAYR